MAVVSVCIMCAALAYGHLLELWGHIVCNTVGVCRVGISAMAAIPKVTIGTKLGCTRICPIYWIVTMARTSVIKLFSLQDSSLQETHTTSQQTGSGGKTTTLPIMHHHFKK